jgi:hypothetical protein
MRWKRPYEIIISLSDYNYCIKLMKNNRTVVKVHKMTKGDKESCLLPTSKHSRRLQEGTQKVGRIQMRKSSPAVIWNKIPSRPFVLPSSELNMKSSYSLAEIPIGHFAETTRWQRTDHDKLLIASCVRDQVLCQEMEVKLES